MAKRRDVLLRLLFALYVIVLIYFLFFSERYGRTPENEHFGVNLVPFKEIKRYIEHRNAFGFELLFLNLFGNILAFIPLGFAIPAIFARCRKFYIVTILVLLSSMLVEIGQFIHKHGTADIDDVILNTVGGVIGYIIFSLIRRHRRLKREGSQVIHNEI